MMRVRAALRIVCRREHLRKTLLIALIVGTILAAINHGDHVVRGEASAGNWLKIAITYCVPFIVANLGLLAGKRTELEAASGEPAAEQEPVPAIDVSQPPGGGRV